MGLRAWIRSRPKGGDPVDPVPVEVPARVRQPDDLKTRIRQAVQFELSQSAARRGFGTFEEEDDFSLDEEDDLLSGHEVRPLEPVPGSGDDPTVVTEEEPTPTGESAEGAVDP